MLGFASQSLILECSSLLVFFLFYFLFAPRDSLFFSNDHSIFHNCVFVLVIPWARLSQFDPGRLFQFLTSD